MSVVAFALNGIIYSNLALYLPFRSVESILCKKSEVNFGRLHSVAETADGETPGRFPQVAGLAFSFDSDLPANDRVVSLAVKDRDDNIIDTVVRDGELVGEPERTFRIVTLNFLAGGGDGFPFPDRDRVDLAQTDAADRTGVATFAPDGSEQDVLAEFLATNFADNPFNLEDTSPEFDERIQNLDFREDTVLNSETGLEIMGTPASESLFGTDFEDLILGLSGNDKIFGRQGSDTLNGGSGKDLLKGNNGSDILSGGSGSDTLKGGDHSDFLRGSQGRDFLYGGNDDDILNGGLNRDFLDGGNGGDILNGGQAGDILIGGEGSDILNGGQGRDILTGGKGSDILNGGQGRDILTGGEGSDILNGGQGKDILTGGEGSDIFVYRSANFGVRDIITDFTPGADSIDLSLIFTRPIFGSSTPVEDYITFVQRGSNTLIFIDFNGDRPNLDSTGLAVLRGVDSSALSKEDFIF